MAKIDVKSLLTAGFTQAQIDMLSKAGAVREAPKASCKVVDYTTTAGKRSTYLSVPAARVFVQLSKAEEVIKALQEGLVRAGNGEIDETKKSKGTVEE